MGGQVISRVTAGGGTHLISSSFYGTCTTAAATAAKEVIINDPGITDTINFINGMTLTVKFTLSNTVANPTITVFNNSGTETAPVKGATTLLETKPIYRLNTKLDAAGTAPSTSAATSWTAGAIVAFVYDGQGWVETSSWDNNTTYANYSFGNGYAVCSTAADTVAKTATYSSYALTVNGIVAVKFTNGISVANPTLSINSKTATPIWWHGAALTDTDLIKAGDIVTLIYNKVALSTGVYEIIALATDSSITTATDTVPNITDVGSTPTLGTAIDADDITGWTTNTPTSVTGKAVVIETTNTTIKVDTNETLEIPASVVTGRTTENSVTVTPGTAATLNYTARSIPNVTDVGSTPTLGTPITVVTSVT